MPQSNPKPNVELLKRTLAHIEAHPGEWDQKYYRCGTGTCFAGHAALLAGGQWAFESDHDEHMVADDADDPMYVFDGEIHVSNRAERVLGLASPQADELFESYNSLDDLRRIIARLCESAEATS
jgi:hypothetical protein